MFKVTDGVVEEITPLLSRQVTGAEHFPLYYNFHWAHWCKGEGGPNRLHVLFIVQAKGLPI